MQKSPDVLNVFCGLFSYHEQLVPSFSRNFQYHDFEDIFNEDQNIQVLRKIFYPNFANLIIAGKCSDAQISSESCFRHLVRSDEAYDKSFMLVSPDGEFKVPFTVVKLDFLLFPDHISRWGNEKMGIYAIHVKFRDKMDDPGMVSSFIHRFRLFDSQNRIHSGEKSFTTLDFIQNFVLPDGITLKGISDIIGSKLKVFTVIDTGDADQNSDQILLNTGTAQLIRTEGEEHTTKNTDEFNAELLRNNIISVYSNWKALILFDSCTVVGHDLGDLAKTWGTTYLLIYLHCLKMKFYLFHVNSELSGTFRDIRKPELLRARFIRFISQNNLHSISFNILPNLLYRKIHQSLDIQQEVDQLENEISRISTLIAEKNERTLNRLIFLLALLGVVSVMFHTTELVAKLLDLSPVDYYTIGYPVIGIVLLVVSFYFIRLKRSITH